MNKRKFYSDGFTLVELLIVIVIIGVLAGISVAAYSGVQDKANNSVVQNDLKQLATKLELYNAENSAYPTTLAQLESLQFTVSKNAYLTKYNNLLYCYSALDPQSYTVYALAKSKVAYMVSNLDNSPKTTTSGSMNCNTSGYTDTWVAFAVAENPQWRAWAH